MKAIRYDRFGGPEELHLVDMADPAPSPGAVAIEVHATSVIPGDWKLRKGLLKHLFPVEPPKVPGRDGAGIVRAVGAGVDAFVPGDRVAFTCEHVEQGSYAQVCVRPVASVVRLPDGLSFVEGAALMHAGSCAYMAVVETARVKAGDKVLVHAAAGSIGGMAVQLCKHLGAAVTGTCSARNVDHVLALGADRAIAYDRTDFAAEVSGQDAVIDLVGGDTHARSYEVLRPGGMIAWLIAAPFEDRSPEFDVNVVQVAVRDTPQIMGAVMDLAAAGHLKPLVADVLPLDGAAEAHRRMEAGTVSRGRIILEPQKVSQ